MSGWYILAMFAVVLVLLRLHKMAGDLSALDVSASFDAPPNAKTADYWRNRADIDAARPLIKDAQAKRGRKRHH